MRALCLVLLVAVCSLPARAEPRGDPQIARDVEVMVGGMFAVDHLGSAYDAIVARAHARPDAYVPEVVANAVAHSTPLQLGDHYAPAVLTRLAADTPAAARAAAHALRPRFEHALAETKDPRVQGRLRDRVAELAALDK